MAAEPVAVRTLLPRPADGLPTSRPRRATHLRLVSVFRPGWRTLLVALLTHHRLPLGHLVPEPGPRVVQGNTLKVPIAMPLAA
jgi:hypothetical protein